MTSISSNEMSIVHTGPGTLAGRYLRTFWQPVCRSEDLSPGHAKPIRVMSEDFTLYRGESGVCYMVAFRCAHRGTQLSTGRVEGDHIRCRYHGWKYEGSGQCIEQPGEEKSLAVNVKIRSYPTKEYLGLIFVYLGDGPLPPFRRLPDLELPGLRQVGPPEIWPCNYFNRLDNSVDHVHVAFTHRESLQRIGRGDLYPDVPQIVPEETEYGLRIAGIFPERKQYSFFHMPNSSQLRIPARIEGSLEDAASLWTDRVFWYVPIDDTNCVAFIVDRILLSEEAAKEYEQRRERTRASVSVSPNQLGENILRGETRIEDIPSDTPPYYLFWVEDYAILVGQGAIADRSHDTLGRVDRAQVLLRKIWQRELSALAQGRPTKQWLTPPPGLAEQTDVPFDTVTRG